MLFNTAGSDDFVIVAWKSSAVPNFTVQIPSSAGSTFNVFSTFNSSVSYPISSNIGYLSFFISRIYHLICDNVDLLP